MPIRINEEDGVRYLQFGAHWIQGAMRLSRPWSLELDYTRDMMMPLLLRRGRWPRSVLQVGLGAGSITRFLHRHLPDAKLEVVEIDAEVLLNAWQFFKLPKESERLRIELGDGYRYLATTRRRFDLILIDGFNARGSAGRLHSLPFYRLCRTRLSGSGVMATNLLTRRARAQADAGPILKAFDDRVLVMPPCDANTVVVAAAGLPIRLDLPNLHARARQLKDHTRLSLLSSVAGLQRARGGEAIDM